MQLADAWVALGEQKRALELLTKTQQALFKEYEDIDNDPENKAALQSGPHRIVWILDLFAAAQSAAGDRNGCLKTLEKMDELLESNAPDSDAPKQLLFAFEFPRVSVIESFAREGLWETALEKAEKLKHPYAKATALIRIAQIYQLHQKGITPRHEVYTKLIDEA